MVIVTSVCFAVFRLIFAGVNLLLEQGSLFIDELIACMVGAFVHCRRRMPNVATLQQLKRRSFSSRDFGRPLADQGSKSLESGSLSVSG